MNIIAASVKKYWLYIFICLLVGCINLCYLLGYNVPVFFTLEILAGVLLLYLLFFQKKFLFYALVFLIPASVPIGIGGGSSISFPSEFVVFLLGIFIIGRAFTGTSINRDLLFHPITIILCADLCWMLICSFYSTIPLYSYKRAFIRLIYLAVFYFFAAELFKNRKNIPLAFVIYGIGMIIPVLSSITFHARYNFVPAASYKMTVPFFNDHTIYGAVLAFLAPVLVIIAAFHTRNDKRKTLKILLWSLAGIIIVGLVLSFSRAAWLSILITLVFAALIWFRTKFSTFLIGTCLLMLIIYLNFDSITELARRNDSKSNARDLSEHVESVSNIQTDASNMERINRWKCALRMFADKPIVGFGPGTYQYNYGLYQVRSEMTRISTVSGNRGHAHSEYLTYLSEMGLLGLIIFLAQLFFAVYTGMKIIYKSRDRFTQTLATGLLLALFTIYIHSIFNAFLDIDKMAMLAFGALAGLVMLDISYKKELSTTAGDSDISSNIERS